MLTLSSCCHHVPVRNQPTYSPRDPYFIAALSPTVALDISGDDIEGGTTSDSWKHCYLPVETPVEVQPGDRLLLTFGRSQPGYRETPFRQAYRWEGSILRGNDVLVSFSQRMRC